MISNYVRLIILCFLVYVTPRYAFCQQGIFVNMAPVDGIDLNPNNILNFQVTSSLDRSISSRVSGTIRYRRLNHYVRYSFNTVLQPGINMFTAEDVGLRLEYSSTAIKELFEYHRKLPQGIYEYCVEILPQAGGESGKEIYNECTYHKSQDLFLINLADPPDDAKIYEYNPSLSWVVNYPFAAELTYRLRVAEIKEGQNNTAAINRNNPVYDEKNLMQLSQVYPVYARPLEKFKSYAWTVDAYYKGILLGGSEVWKFTIIEDSIFSAANKNISYVDIKRESGNYRLYVPGLLKLKYTLDNLKTDSLSLKLVDKKNKEIKLKETKFLKASYGDNLFTLNFMQYQPLKHKQYYTLYLTSVSDHTYRILFQYTNPELIK